MSEKSTLTLLLDWIADDNRLSIKQEKRLLRTIRRRIIRWQISNRIFGIWKELKKRLKHWYEILQESLINEKHAE